MRAKKSLGQNFLHDESIVKKIIGALNLRENETVVEIGPGTGALTETLLEQAGHVIAVEFDRDMIAVLTERFAASKNLELIKTDALNVDFAAILPKALPIGTAKLVANLPYNISTPILQRLIDQRGTFSTIVLMFQREVVERITAKPGNKNRGFLSVLVENIFTTEYLFDVPPQAFQPVPKVWSGIVRLTPKVSVFADFPVFRKIVSASFAHKRKTILNNLKPVVENAAAMLAASGIDPKRRAETLTLDEWKALAHTIIRSKNITIKKVSN